MSVDISFVNGTTASTGTSVASTTVTLPSGLQGGDVVWIDVAAYAATYPTIAISSTGTTPVVQGTPKTNVLGGTEVTSAIYKVVAAGTTGSASTDASAVVTVSCSGSPTTAFWEVLVGAWRNVDTTKLPADTIPAATISTGTSINAPAISSTTYAGEWIVYMVTSSTAQSSYSGHAGTQRETNSGQGILCDSNGTVGSSGSSVGGGTFSLGSSGIWVAWTISMVPLVLSDTGTGGAKIKKLAVAASGNLGIRISNSAEGGTNGTTVLTTNSGGTSGNAFDAIGTGTLAVMSFDNAHAAHGTLSYKFATGSPAANTFAYWSTTLTSSSVVKVWFRTYVYITAHTGQLRLIGVRNGTTIRANVALDSTGHVLLLNAAGTIIKTSTSIMPLNAWFRLEGFFVGDATVGQVECKMFTTSMDATTADEVLTTTAAQNNGGTITRIEFGNPSSVASYNVWVDDLAASTSNYIGPVYPQGPAAVSMHKMALSGTAKETDLGTASIRLKKMALSGTAKETEFGTGSIRLKKMALGSAGHAKLAGTGSIRLKKMALSGSGSATQVGTASVHMKKMALSGTANETDKATGSIRLKKMGIAASATSKLRGTGSIRLKKMALSIIARETEFGTGSIRLKKMGITGAGHEAPGAGNASVHMKKMALSGTVKETDRATSAVHLHKMAVSGSGNVVGSFGLVHMHKMGLVAAGRGTTSGPLHISMHKMSLSGTGSEINHITASVQMHKLRVHASNLHGHASSMFIFTAV